MSNENSFKSKIAEKLIFGYSMSRSALFLLESKPLPYIRRLFDKRAFVEPPEDFKKYSLDELKQLLMDDSENIAAGVYPQSVLSVERPTKHFKRVLKIWKDAFFIAYRRSRNKNKEFSNKASLLLDSLPSYYKRNFHNQTDGYLSTESAEIYDHQVDMLFSGSTDAMRRTILKPLKNHFKSQRKLKILELGCGAGSFTQFLVKSFPDAQVIAVDLSSPYLEKAKEKLKGENVSFICGEGESLDFKDETFDAVVSVFLFHELPESIREKIIIESKRVLKKGGFFGLVDSLQSHDNKKLNWALNEFPKSFHEPFYKNYTLNPIEDLIEKVFEVNATKVSKHFLSKCVSIEKSI